MRHKEKDPETFNEKKRDWEARKWESDPIYRETKRARAFLWQYVHKAQIGVNTRAATYRDLPYGPADLRDHLESLWQPGMTWENYGKRPEGWCIDHRVAVYDLLEQGVTDYKTIHALANIRPLFFSQNESKGRRPAPVEPTFSREREEYTGEAHHLSKLTDEAVREIKIALLTPRRGLITDLARQYGVARNAIQQISDGKSWTHVIVE
jgi:hypothetical protein